MHLKSQIQTTFSCAIGQIQDGEKSEICEPCHKYRDELTSFAEFNLMRCQSYHLDQMPHCNFLK